MASLAGSFFALGCANRWQPPSNTAHTAGCTPSSGRPAISCTQEAAWLASSTADFVFLVRCSRYNANCRGRIVSAGATHFWRGLLGIRSRCLLHGFRAPLLRPIPRVNLHWCMWSEANFVTMPRVKRSEVFWPKKVLRSHLRASNFLKIFLGEPTPDPPSLILRIREKYRYKSRTASQSNACFILVAAPLLKVFRRPWNRVSFDV